ncbi:MAG: acyl-CoA dehydrogenase family protein [Pseudomonadales bacterium]|jgi:acyl-CoA dehydrogenase|nr:acyl-CoA dehydrogenase family protein [Pseudomonadales bacterium]MCP5320019.1 acyl-CoA dehydrogenase family protein [Pseudomonadales bacterium]MCP5338234.1 acyl-CoA dehydrogenase family protein [Pseudomonadales bacterium]
MEDLEKFRTDVRDWMEANCPPSQRTPASHAAQYWGGRRAKFVSEDAQLWFERMLSKGWTVPEWPREYGGAGLTGQHARILRKEMVRLGCRAPLFGLGIWMLGPALFEFGNEEQKRIHLPAIAEGRIRWCQGYSEPNAGSDLASLQTRAEDHGDHFIVNGSKIWTSHADHSDWIFCLVRTDPNARNKQSGISFLLIDMATPGVSVTPIKLINGDSEFCQTFFDNVRVPRENLVGKLNEGWSVAKALLRHERKLMSDMGDTVTIAAHTPIECARQYLPSSDGRIDDPLLRDALARHEMQVHAIGLTQLRILEETRAGVGNGLTPLIMKYCGTEEEKRKYELMMAMMGNQGIGWMGDDFTAAELATTRQCLFNKALSIAGGTSEIQLNIIAKRALGLPGVT